jgi:uncharacterized protein (DUF302 family)
MLRDLVWILLGLGLLGCAPTKSDSIDSAKQLPQLVTRNAAIPHARAVKQLEQALEEHPTLSLMQRIDHHRNAQTVGLVLPPSSVLVFGNPALGTPLMQQAPSLALDLPQRMLIRATESGVELLYAAPQAVFARHGLGPDHRAIATVSEVLASLANRALQQSPNDWDQP